MDYIEKIITMFENAEGANKILKGIQCMSYLFEFFTMNSTDKITYSKLGEKISEARKIFKLFKFLNDIPRLIYLINSPLDNFTKNFNFLTRFFNALFYIFENLSILTNLRFISLNYQPHIEISMSLSWLLTQLFHMSYYVGILKKTYNDEEDLRSMEIKQFKVKDIYQKMKLLSRIRIYLLLGLVRCFGDFMLSCYELKLFENFLGTKIMKFVVNIAGLISALISIYQQFFSSSILK